MARAIAPTDLSWRRTFPVEGMCQECGTDLSTTIVITATPDWVRRTETIEQQRRAVNRAVADKVMARHARVCSGHR